ncbi:MAG: hypothetical protein IK114_08670 [Fibrobacter sp.]|nr:hypothetical protein [Fibrobacter sp.]
MREAWQEYRNFLAKIFLHRICPKNRGNFELFFPNWRVYIKIGILSIRQTAGGFPALKGKNIMKRDEFARFLGELRKTKENGQDIDAFVKNYEHRNVYFYNDGSLFVFPA